jgi:GH25 family lysozyme M1 (1,4-beta-N-acetylmuramidase)
MRSLNNWEKKIVQHLSSLQPGTKMDMIGFLNSIFFRRDFGRALILNMQSRYAMFFVGTDFFFDTDKRKEEISRFLNLFSFLKDLASQGYLSFHPIENGTENSVYYVQDSFNKILISANTNPVVLNDVGDCLSASDTILTKEKKPLFKGIIFEHETFELIAKAAISGFILTKNLEDLANASSPGKESLSKSSLLTVGLTSMTWIGILGFFLNFHVQMQAHENKLGQLLDSHQEIKNNIQLISEQALLRQPTEKQITIPRAHYGIDVSKWNGNILTELNSVDSISFVICKATEGVNYVDPDFAPNMTFLKERKIIRGFYHFFHTKDDPIKQAEFFARVISQDLGEITPTVDIEQESLPQGTQMTATKIQVEKIQVDLLQFLNHLERSIGRVPMIYTDEAFANQYLNSETFAKYPLWLAEYSNTKYPIIPASWKGKGFRIWQKKDNYSIQSRATDLDVFFGELKELLK